MQNLDIPIIMYHEVSNSENLAKIREFINSMYIIDSKDFEAQLELIKNSGYKTVTVSELFENKKRLSGDKYICLTFDDGYSGNFEFAFKILNKFNFKATFFITAGNIGKENMLTASQIKIMSASGMEIGSHTLSHKILDSLSNSEIVNELQESKKILENIGSVQVKSLSYPNGNYTQLSNRIARDLGYSYLCSSNFGYFKANNNDIIPRIVAPSKLSTLNKILKKDVIWFLSNKIVKILKNLVVLLLGKKRYNDLYLKLFNIKESI